MVTNSDRCQGNVTDDTLVNDNDGPEFDVITDAGQGVDVPPHSENETQPQVNDWTSKTLIPVWSMHDVIENNFIT